MLFSDEIAHKSIKRFTVEAEEKALTYFARNFFLGIWKAKADVNDEGKIVVYVPVEYPIFVEEPDPEYPDEEPEYVDYFDTWEDTQKDNEITLEYLENDWLLQEDSHDPNVEKNFDWSNKYRSSDINDVTIIISSEEAVETDMYDKQVTLQNGFVFYAGDSLKLVNKVETPNGTFNVYLSVHVD